MTLLDVALLVGGGLAAGFVAGIIGVGGGVIFAPVLFFYFSAAGADPVTIAPLVIGTSLLCTVIATLASSFFQHRRGAVNWRAAVSVGVGSAAAILLMTRFVTTQPWFSGDVFKIAFSTVLVAVVIKMLVASGDESTADGPEKRPGPIFLLSVGSVTGVVSSAAGVGGGVVLVPAYHQFLNMKMIRAVGSSSATIIFVASTGVISYMLHSSVKGASTMTLGFVDWGTALLLSVPSVITVRLGVLIAHKVNRKFLQRVFAGLAAVVVIRLIVDVLN